MPLAEIRNLRDRLSPLRTRARARSRAITDGAHAAVKVSETPSAVPDGPETVLHARRRWENRSGARPRPLPSRPASRGKRQGLFLRHSLPGPFRPPARDGTSEGVPSTRNVPQARRARCLPKLRAKGARKIANLALPARPQAPFLDIRRPIPGLPNGRMRQLASSYVFAGKAWTRTVLRSRRCWQGQRLDQARQRHPDGVPGLPACSRRRSSGRRALAGSARRRRLPPWLQKTALPPRHRLSKARDAIGLFLDRAGRSPPVQSPQASDPECRSVARLRQSLADITGPAKLRRTLRKLRKPAPAALSARAPRRMPSLPPPLPARRRSGMLAWQNMGRKTLEKR